VINGEVHEPAQPVGNMTPWFGVLGTWQYEDPLDNIPDTKDWRAASSRFSKMMDAEGFMQLYAPDDLFSWDGSVDGLPWSGPTWEAAGDELGYRLKYLQPELRRGIGHSYGGAVIIRAALKVKLHSLLTIGTPANRQLRNMAREAIRRGNLPRWTHANDAHWDQTGALGGLADGSVRFRWAWPPIDRRMSLPGCTEVLVQGVGHSGLLWERAERSLWRGAGLFDALRDPITRV
jgi:hypothetical protein